MTISTANGVDLETLRTSAREAWLTSNAQGKPISGAALGRDFQMSERWGCDRVTEAKLILDAGLATETPDAQLLAGIVAARTTPQAAPVPIGTQGPQATGTPDPQAPQGPAPDPQAIGMPIGTPDPQAPPQSAPQGPHTSVPDPQGPAPLAVPMVPQQRTSPDPISHSPVLSTSSDPAGAPPAAPTPAWMDNYAPLPNPGLPIGTQTPQTRTQPASPAPQAVPQIKPLTGKTKFWFILMTIPFLAPGLAYSAWSIYGYARTGSAPVWLAVLGSPALDGAALFCAVFAAMFESSGQPTKLARLGTYGSILAGVFVNYSRATELHAAAGLHVLLVAPAVIAAVLFELVMIRLRAQARARRETRRSTRMSAHVDIDLWLRHPLLVHRARQFEARERVAEAFPGVPLSAAGSSVLGRVLMVVVPAAVVGILTLWMTGKI